MGIEETGGIEVSGTCGILYIGRAGIDMMKLVPASDVPDFDNASPYSFVS